MLNSKEFVRELQLRHESAWMNPNVGSADAALAALPLTRTDVDDAEARLERFAPFIKKVFPETAADRGLIESPLTEIEHMRAWLNENEGAQLAGKLFLKRDSDLPVAGSVKARGGCYAAAQGTVRRAEHRGRRGAPAARLHSLRRRRRAGRYLLWLEAGVRRRGTRLLR